MKKLRLAFATMAALLTSQAHSCPVNAYFTTTVAPNFWFSPAHCGKPNLDQKWPTACVKDFVNRAYWQNNMTIDGAKPETRIFGGIVTYFVLEYSPDSCNAQFTLPYNDALLVGSYWKGPSFRKLYVVYGLNNTFNIPVTLTRGVTVIRSLYR